MSEYGELSVEMFDSGVNEWHKKSSIPTGDKNEAEFDNINIHYNYKACLATVKLG